MCVWQRIEKEKYLTLSKANIAEAKNCSVQVGKGSAKRSMDKPQIAVPSAMVYRRPNGVSTRPAPRNGPIAEATAGTRVYI